MRSPKLGSSKGDRDARWYRYYAGYSEAFVEDVVDECLQDNLPVLDPWNGSGTTTTVAHDRRRAAIGFDINPVLALVAKSRILGPEVVESLDALTTEIIAQARCEPEPYLANEPLTMWFAPQAATLLRSTERVVYRLTVDGQTRRFIPELPTLNGVSSLAGFFYVVLFDVVRNLLGSFATSNPTWLKTGCDQLVKVRSREIEKRIWAAQKRLKKQVMSRPVDVTASPVTTIDVASSTNLPLTDESVGLVISSPPYCTRIDYAMATRSELAVLGCDEHRVRRLRESMVGTPTVRQVLSNEVDSRWGTEVSRFLAAVKAHPSRASKTYYLKYFLGYFQSMHRSLAELYRVACPGGVCFLVIQDSYYKEVHNDLARGLSEMAVAIGWSVSSAARFPVPRTFAQVNARSRKYRTTFDATETVLTLRK